MESLYCPICGVEINKKNYNLNKYAFEEENSIDSIKFCPICGVELKYLSDKPFVYKIKREELNDGIIKILDHAMKLEVFNGDFYKKAAMLSKDLHISRLFKDLANIEYAHANVHKRLACYDKLPEINNMDYSKYNEDEILLDMAEKREKHAVEYYNKYREKTNFDTIKLVFDALKSVEINHIHIINEK